VTAVENPLTSLADDIATTRRALERTSGPVIVVGHSFGGAAITGAAVGNDNVKALVYINAFAPDLGETIGELAVKYGPAPLGDALVPDAAGFLFIDPNKFRDVFCGDVWPVEARIMAASQKPVSAGAFAEPGGTPAWRTVPSYYLVGTRDRAILPEVQRFMAARMGAHVTEIAASHASFVSHPSAVVRVIEGAALDASR
jgi:pimeloyl-ACP methyl ester carboxylesterase